MTVIEQIRERLAVSIDSRVGRGFRATSDSFRIRK